MPTTETGSREHGPQVELVTDPSAVPAPGVAAVSSTGAAEAATGPAEGVEVPLPGPPKPTVPQKAADPNPPIGPTPPTPAADPNAVRPTAVRPNVAEVPLPSFDTRRPGRKGRVMGEAHAAYQSVDGNTYTVQLTDGSGNEHEHLRMKTIILGLIEQARGGDPFVVFDALGLDLKDVNGLSIYDFRKGEARIRAQARAAMGG